jgi:bifunctional DNase/RNase
MTSPYRRRLIWLSALLLGVVWLWLAAAETPQRILKVDEAELVEVELATVTLLPFADAPVVLLREPLSNSVVPIFIGPAEARAIVMAQQGVQPPRPMTHDLTTSLLKQLGGTLERVIVDALHQGTYYGALEIDLGGRRGRTLIDSRPSDALALAIRSGARIMVAPDILEAGSTLPLEDLGDDTPVTALGVTVVAASPTLAEALGLPDAPGVLVSAVEGLAAISGVQAGSYITQVNDQAIAAPLDFLNAVNATPSGRKAQLKVWRDERYRDVELDTGIPSRGERSQRL